MSRLSILSFAILLVLVYPLQAFALNTENAIFDRNFRTLKVVQADNPMGIPVIRLGSDDRLIFSFDEIGEENSYLEYRLLHCNADWQPSRLIESEYIDGFNSIRIEDYAFSTATYIHYVNYRIEIPNPDCRILHSGNYLLQVYDPEEAETTILQARFQVSENGASLSGRSFSRTDLGHNSRWQQLEIEAEASSREGVNPHQDLLLTVSRNGETSNLRKLDFPTLASASQQEVSAKWQHRPELIFPASNEYRRFESTSNAFAGLHVDSLRYMGGNYHVWLKPDYPRADAQYSYDRTQHGRFFVNEYNATDPDLGADYITVHFRLETPRLPNCDVMVDGEFAQGLDKRAVMMEYDATQMAYLAEIPLKQGLYNYQYVVKPHDVSTPPSPTPIEGDHYETDNEYVVCLYLRRPMARADRLLSTTVITYDSN